MLNTLFKLARPALFKLGGERAHELTLGTLRAGLYPRLDNTAHRELSQSLWGLDFPNPIGMAAGFDKNAQVPDAVLGMGFGFTEIGTVTPKPQLGNRGPRVFRLIEQRAMINRLGFNNEGHAAALARLQSRSCNHCQDQSREGNPNGIVGVNVGANKTSTDRVADYVAGLEIFQDVASYFMINISSPNTPGLRDLQAPEALDELLGACMTKRAELVDAGAPRRPIIVKLSPDIASEDLPPIVARLMAHNVDGIAVSNTTLSRPASIAGAVHGDEAGGLSGAPLFQRSTVMLARVYQLTKGDIPLIGIGGIDSGKTALAKIRAGATLVQLYTGLVYGGADLIRDMHETLSAHVRQNKYRSITDAVGRDAQIWADKSLDG